MATEDLLPAMGDAFRRAYQAAGLPDNAQSYRQFLALATAALLGGLFVDADRHDDRDLLLAIAGLRLGDVGLALVTSAEADARFETMHPVQLPDAQSP
jgi:hypothetical protein